MSDSNLVLLDTKGTKVCDVDLVDGEIVFGKDDIKWVWVLDARHEPYPSLSLETVLHRAAEVRKEYVLVAADA